MFHKSISGLKRRIIEWLCWKSLLSGTSYTCCGPEMSVMSDSNTTITSFSWGSLHPPTAPLARCEARSQGQGPGSCKGYLRRAGHSLSMQSCVSQSDLVNLDTVMENNVPENDETDSFSDGADVGCLSTVSAGTWFYLLRLKKFKSKIYFMSWSIYSRIKFIEDTRLDI